MKENSVLSSEYATRGIKFKNIIGNLLLTDDITPYSKPVWILLLWLSCHCKLNTEAHTEYKYNYSSPTVSNVLCYKYNFPSLMNSVSLPLASLLVIVHYTFTKQQNRHVINTIRYDHWLNTTNLKSLWYS